MAYDGNGLQVLADNMAIGTGLGSIRRFFSFVTNDTLAQVETDGYFDDKADDMNTGDLILVSFDNDGTPGAKLFTVTKAAGDITLGSAHGVAALTDSSGGTADGTVEVVSGSGADAAINNNFAELAAKVNALAAAL